MSTTILFVVLGSIYGAGVVGAYTSVCHQAEDKYGKPLAFPRKLGLMLMIGLRVGK